MNGLPRTMLSPWIYKLAERAGFERFRARRQFTFRERHRGLHGQITEVFCFQRITLSVTPSLT